MAEETVETSEVDVPETPEPVDYAAVTQDRFKALRAAGSLPPQAEPGSDAPAETPADPAPAVDETAPPAETPSETDTDEDAKPPRLQKRINTLTRRAKEAEARNEALEARLLALERGTQQPSTPATEPQTGPPDPDDFETDDAYNRAVARHEAREILREEREQDAVQRQLADQDAQLQQARRQLQTSIEAARETYDDFDELMETSDAAPSDLLKKAVAYNDNAGHLGYHLLKNPDDMERLNAITAPQTLLRELARFEARVLPAEPDDPPPPPRRTPSAPPPATPPTGDRSGGGTPKRPEDMSYAEYKKYRRSPT